MLAIIFGLSDIMAENYIDLSGEWYYRLHEAPPEVPGEGQILLPGTLDTNHRGIPVREETNTARLSRKFTYEGNVSYFRTIDVPYIGEGKDIQLVIERTRPSTLYIDGQKVGSRSSLSTPHIYSVEDYLTPGRHEIEIVINNLDSIPASIRRNSNSSSEYTQTNWNGMTGNIRLEIYPFDETDPQKDYSESGSIKLSGDNLGEHYNSDRNNSNHDLSGSKEISMPRLKISDNRLEAAGQPVFLRGTVDSAVFPLTGYPPTDDNFWKNYFDVIRNYGLNHVRFHSWCPPEAAFSAADKAGVYLQVELPVWGEFDRELPSKTDFLRKELDSIIEAYGHHPSFAILSLGNELWGDISLMQEFAERARELHPELIVTYSSDLYSSMYGYRDGEDIMIGSRNGMSDDRSTDLRGSFSFIDTQDGGRINREYPNSIFNYSAALEGVEVPVISHEIGQYQSYPDYNEIPKFTGVLLPLNLIEFMKRAEGNGVLQRSQKYYEASSKWASKLYKTEVEAQLRTPELSGFQMMALQDYPGQGTANVGLVDLFMNPKKGISPEEWRESCNETVFLAEWPKFCFENNEEVRIPIKLYDYSSRGDGLTTARWSTGFASGKLNFNSKKGLSDIGIIRFMTPGVNRPTSYTLKIENEDGTIKNNYEFWVYPSKLPEVKNVFQTSSLEEALRMLEEGKKVLLTPESNTISEASLSPLFTTDFWNYRMYRTLCDRIGAEPSPGTLGLLINDNHPAFAAFPTAFHTDKQWFPIIASSRPLIIDRLPAEIQPIVEVIDNTERNYRLGLILECMVGKGKLMIVTSDYDKASVYPEGRWLFQSLKEYMGSGEFKPSLHLTAEQLTNLLTKPSNNRLIRELKNETYDSRWE